MNKTTIKVAALLSMYNLSVVATVAKLQCSHLGHDNLLQTEGTS